MDETDIQILEALQLDGRLSNAELGRRLGLSPPAVHARVRKLEQEGIITGYRATLNREKVGFDMLCFVHVSLDLHQDPQVQSVREALSSMPEVLECHHVTGTDDYLLKIVVRNRGDLERFIGTVTPIQGVAKIQTSLVLADIKSNSPLPLIGNIIGLDKKRRSKK